MFFFSIFAGRKRIQMIKKVISGIDGSGTMTYRFSYVKRTVRCPAWSVIGLSFLKPNP